ncbi:MAG: site-specific DNA-methyltransferase [Bacteroidetes bacterium]|nr:site-specific DNA-methyltransferase [Bacteroidota bacterium]
MLKEKNKKKYKNKVKPSFVKESDDERYFLHPPKHLSQNRQETFLSIKQASEWATDYLKKEVTTSNISYLIQYGRVKKMGDNGSTLVEKNELLKYYESLNGSRELNWKEKLGNDLNWTLSFDQYKESETTKHVHRLHPYKGKFIPQLVEYFLDSKKDKFKKEIYFKEEDIVLDPFCGSGTTLVQASELGMHAIGIDVSAFNAMISNVKVGRYDFVLIQKEIDKISEELKKFIAKSKIDEFENALLEELNKFNNKYFPVPEYKYNLQRGKIDENKYGTEKEKMFFPVFEKLVKKYKIKLKQKQSKTFLDKWYFENVRQEIDFVYKKVRKIKDKDVRNVISVILSRTIRSCRATTHADLATLLEPVNGTYYCSKHGKVCKPLFSIFKWWDSYSKDTVTRFKEYKEKRKNNCQRCLTGDSRSIDIFKELKEQDPYFSRFAKKKKIKGIFSSPPYVGVIDYHEQHAYAYDLFRFERKDNLEIGPLSKGQGREAKESYAKGIAEVLNNCKKFFVEDYNVFLVANDKYNMYPTIAENAGMKIVNQFKRPVLNRTEKDKGAYSEIIFHLKEK